MDLLDRIDSRRHDTEEILALANGFADLPEEEHARYLGVWEYAGLDGARHPLSALLRESHNETCVVRDLDGALWMLAQESSTSDQWSRGPLCRGHLIDDGVLVDFLDDPNWLGDADIPGSADELRQLLDDLPDAGGSLQSY